MNITGDKDFDELLNRVVNIFETKGKDYAEKDDRLAQFRKAADKYDLTMPQVLGVYIDKHIESLNKWIKGQELSGEPIEEKLLDIIVYSLLAFKMVRENKPSAISMIQDDLAEVRKNIMSSRVATAESVKDDRVKCDDHDRIGVISCDNCGELAMISKPETSHMSFDAWKLQVTDSKFFCNTCCHDDTSVSADETFGIAVRLIERLESDTNNS